MKRIIIALILVLALGCVAVAGSATEAPDQAANYAAATDNAPATDTALAEDSVGEDAPADDAPAEEAPCEEAQSDADETAVPEDKAADDALAEALEALHKARMEKAEEELKAELDEYVAAGKLTQEQADLIMNHFQNHFQNMERDDRPGGDFFGDWMNGDQWGGNHMGGRGNHMGGQKQYGNWQFGWSFDWHFPGQEGDDNPFPDMFGGNHM